MPLPGRHLTSVLLRREGDLFLFDCGEGTQISLRQLKLRWKKINVVFLSHTHADHVTGLPGILMLSSQVDRDDPLYIIGPPNTAKYVETSRTVLNMHINYDIVVKEITEPGIVYEDDGFSVRAFGLRHTRQCFGYALEEESRPGVFHPELARDCGVPEGPLWSKLQKGESVESADGSTVEPDQVLGAARHGRKFAYVTDTRYFDGISREVRGADLLVCEGMFTDDLTANAQDKGHMTATQAARVARDAGNVGKLGLIHYSPRYTEHDLRKLASEARLVFKHSFLTRDRQVIDIPFTE